MNHLPQSTREWKYHADAVYNWLISYFRGRGHVTSYGGDVSEVACITASIVQGSVLGPVSYVVGASDLHPRHKFNILVKFADDTYLLVGSSHLGTVREEFEGISDWAKKNNLRLNTSKTREMIIFGKRKPRRVIPPIVPEAARVETMRVLGVTIRSDLRMTTHVDNVLTSCSSSMYALRVLRSHGLTPSGLHEVTRMTTIAHLMYASPAWWGYTSAGSGTASSS